jgi:ABC-type multidrug transport system fused ATPase/permease subunit
MMTTNETVEFRHFNPIIYTVMNIIWVVALVVSAYYLINNLNFPIAAEVIFWLFILMLIINFTVGKKLRDVSGKFLFGDYHFEIKSFRTNATIY